MSTTNPRNQSTAATPPVPTEELEAMLIRLRLPAIRDRLDALLEEAARREMNLLEALAWLCAAEVARKDQLRIEMALRLARFPYVRTLEAFDFEPQPSIDPPQIRELATCRWVANGDTLLLLGPPGVGKTHLAEVLGRETVRLGHGVQYVGAMELIIDELGYLLLEPNAAYLFFQLISRCYQRGSVLITSNRPVMEWGEVFGDQVVPTAILDRLLHYSHVLTIRGDSYRLWEKRRSGLRGIRIKRHRCCRFEQIFTHVYAVPIKVRWHVPLETRKNDPISMPSPLALLDLCNSALD